MAFIRRMLLPIDDPPFSHVKFGKIHIAFNYSVNLGQVETTGHGT
jgi:hypothetical protein